MIPARGFLVSVILDGHIGAGLIAAWDASQRPKVAAWDAEDWGGTQVETARGISLSDYRAK